MKLERPSFLLVLCFLIAAAGGPSPEVAVAKENKADAPGPDAIAESYVKLVLALGQHDDDYVDAYYGPPELKKAVESTPLSLNAIRSRADQLLAALGEMPPDGTDEMAKMRHRFQRQALTSLRARTEMVAGKKYSFDEESRALYDAVAPHHDDAHFGRILARLEELLPGDGPLDARWTAFRQKFAVPDDKVDAVFRAAIEECKRRTLKFIELPDGESFEVEYVRDKSWSGYNWYQGGYHSLIQVNRDLTIFIDRAIDLACHEGYPGHHVFNMLLEKNLVRDRGWMEFSVYPLFSPQSLIAEGSANYGVDIAFPGEERVDYERATLFPLAGLEPDGAGPYYEALELVSKLNYAGNEAARRYLDGEIDAGEAADWLARFALQSPARAQQRIRFIDQYRSYVINYNLGKDLVRKYVEAQGGDQMEKKWDAFARLLSTPTLPSDLQ